MLASGTIVVCSNGQRALRLWTPCQLNTTEVAIPHAKSNVCGICRLLFDLQEMFALIFQGECWLQLYRLGKSELILVQCIRLNFFPSRLLWLACTQSLLLCQWNSNENVHAVRLGESTKVQRVYLDGEPRMIRSWCVWREQNGKERGIILYDSENQSVKKFSLE